MSEHKVFTPQKIEKLLFGNGFVLDRIKGSHHIYINRIKKVMIVVPFHKKDLPKGTAHSILKQAGIKI